MTDLCSLGIGFLLGGVCAFLVRYARDPRRKVERAYRYFCECLRARGAEVDDVYIEYPLTQIITMLMGPHDCPENRCHIYDAELDTYQRFGADGFAFRVEGYHD